MSRGWNSILNQANKSLAATINDPNVSEVPAGADQSPDLIRSMFEQITPTYDRLNHLFSGQLDHYWRKRTAAELLRDLNPCGRILDIATGTGDLASALKKNSTTQPRIVGLDFTRSMLDLACKKYGLQGFNWIEGDGLNLPFASASFDACCIAFGLRNMIDRAAALREMRRILRPGGRLAILEFSQPKNPLVRKFYDLYSFTIMPRLGKWISGSKAYLYLPSSIRVFWSRKELLQRMQEAGFTNVRNIDMTLGVVSLHLGEANARNSS